MDAAKTYRACVITDNEFIYNVVKGITEQKGWPDFDFYYSENNPDFRNTYGSDGSFQPINLKTADDKFFSQYDVFLSIHCKQIFPAKLVRNHRCLNVHPGFNPYNRGWYPQAFSIINRLPAGVTIHEMDEQLDHGPIIVREQVPVSMADTSYDVYKKIQQLEKKLLELYLEDLVTGNYHAIRPEAEGNINLRQDFLKLCELDREKTGTFGEFIDLLRSVTFPGYKNAYFFDDDGNKIYVELKLEPAPVQFGDKHKCPAIVGSGMKETE